MERSKTVSWNEKNCLFSSIVYCIVRKSITFLVKLSWSNCYLVHCLNLKPKSQTMACFLGSIPLDIFVLFELVWMTLPPWIHSILVGGVLLCMHIKKWPLELWSFENLHDSVPGQPIGLTSCSWHHLLMLHGLNLTIKRELMSGCCSALHWKKLFTLLCIREPNDTLKPVPCQASIFVLLAVVHDIIFWSHLYRFLIPSRNFRSHCHSASCCHYHIQCCSYIKPT